jgi:CheY-like chemotaxis protein
MKMEKIKVLAIDDKEDYYEVFKLFLEKNDEPFEIMEVATDGRQGLTIIKEMGINNIDLVLLDMQMPIFDGHNFIRYFKNWFGTENMHKIQILSNFADDDLNARVIPAGIALVPLNKEMDMEHIIHSLKQNIGLAERTIEDIANIFIRMKLMCDLKLSPDKYLAEFALYISLHNINLKVSGERTHIFTHISDLYGVTQDNVRINIAKKLKETNMSLEQFARKLLKNL